MPPAAPELPQPIRVLRVITRLNIGGPSIQAMTLADRLRSRGFETLLVHGSLDPGEGDTRYLLHPGVTARALPALRRPLAPLHDAFAFAQLIDIVRDFRPDIVHTHMAKAGALARSAAAVYNLGAGRLRRARVVHTYHGHVLEGYFGPTRTSLFVGAERLLAHVTDRIVAISEAVRHDLVDEHRIGAPGQYRVVPLGFDLNGLARIDAAQRAKSRTALGIPPDAHVVTTVGRLTAIKHHGLFLDCAKRIAEVDAAAIFLIVGDGDLRAALETRAAQLGVADRTRFLGWRRDLGIVYGATDVFLLTSRNEGTPVALIESLAAGVPGVSTYVGGVGDVIDGTDLGRLAPFGDAAALSAHVTDLLADDALRRKLGDAGRRAVTARYGIDRLVDDIEGLYREMLH